MAQEKQWKINIFKLTLNYGEFLIDKNWYLARALIAIPVALSTIVIYYIAYLNITDSLSSFSFSLFIPSLIAFSGLWLTSFSLLTNSIETRRKSSMDILFSLEKDVDFSESKKRLIPINNLENIILLKPIKDIDPNYVDIMDIKNSFIYCANIYEFLGLSIKNNIIDEQLFISLHKSRFLFFWKKVAPTISLIRAEENQQSLYEHVEWLAKRY